jgi:hypothetical protein
VEWLRELKKSPKSLKVLEIFLNGNLAKFPQKSGIPTDDDAAKRRYF